MSTFFPYILTIHIGTIFGVVFLILCADFYGFKWMRGAIPILNYQIISRIHTYMWCGLIILIISGVLLFYPNRDFLLTLSTFRVKIAFVVTLVVNSFYIGNTLPIATKIPYTALSHKQKIKLGISGALSLICWLGSIITGSMLEI